jgi:PAS domain S-box-containing protein
METSRVSASKSFTRWANLIPFLIALVVFSFLVVTAVELVSFPDDGIDDVDAENSIVAIDPNGPSNKKLQKNDKVLTINDIPIDENRFDYNALGKKGGDDIEIVVLRNSELQTARITLSKPSQPLVLNRLVAILIALIFLGVGVGIDAFKPVDRGNFIYSLWFYICSLTLTVSASSTMGSIVTANLFYGLLPLLGAVSVHFHMIFPQQVEWEGKRKVLTGLYSIASLVMLPLLVFRPVELRAFNWFSYYRMGSLIMLALSLLAVMGLLVDSYRHSSSPGVRGKIRLVLLGGLLVAIPFISLTILPWILFEPFLIPYSSAFILLGLLPLTYGYSIFRLHLIEIDQKINRWATYILVFSILGSFYLILYALLGAILPENVRSIPFINTILVLTLASVFIPIHRWVQRLVDTIFYGGWYDYRVGIRQITENLSQMTDLHELATMVSERLRVTLRLEEAVVFLQDQEGDFSVVESSFSSGARDKDRHDFPVLPRSSLTYLLKIGAVERTALLRSLSEVTLTAEELQLLQTEQFHLWVPIIGHGQIQGLLALGPKLGGDIFSGEDMDILRVVVQQLGPVIENIHLLTDLMLHASELEKRVAERTAELYDAKERVEAILASVGDGVIVTDLDGNIMALNLAFERLTGYSAAEVQGSNLFTMLAEENGASKIAAIRESLNSGDIWSDELEGRRKNSSQYNIQFTIAPIHDSSGMTVGYVGSQTDITRQKELDVMKDIFISDVSHELRTPITNISLYIELLESAATEKRPRYLNVVKEQSQVLTKLVEDILDLSRLSSANARPVIFTSSDLNLLIDQVVTAHLPLAEAAGLSLRFFPTRDLPKVPVEQNQFARLVTNLVSNAIRYTQAGVIQVSSGCIDGRISIKVEDSGIGIEPEDLPHIFERFFRGSNVRQSEIHGTGLGLAIVKEIVDFHGGSIEVHSQRGQGSVFQVWLPATQT